MLKTEQILTGCRADQKYQSVVSSGDGLYQSTNYGITWKKLSSKGMLRLRNKWLQRGGEYAPVKPDSNHHNNISSMLTESKRRETLNEVSTEECKSLVGTIKCIL